MDCSEFANLPSKEICELLKDCKFNLFTKHSYDTSLDEDGNEIGYTSIPWIGGDGTMACPSIYEIQKWLREVHNLHIIIYPLPNHYGKIEENMYTGNWVMLTKGMLIHNLPRGYKTFEDALMGGEYYALDFLKTYLTEVESGQRNDTEEHRVGEE